MECILAQFIRQGLGATAGPGGSETAEVLTKGGLATYYLLFVMEIATRRVHFAGRSLTPDELWMKQIGRNLTDTLDGFLNGKQYVIMDRDGKFCPAFREILESEDIESVPLPPQSPDLNAYVERFHRSIKEKCLDRMIFFGKKSMLRCFRPRFTQHVQFKIRLSENLGFIRVYSLCAVGSGDDTDQLSDSHGLRLCGVQRGAMHSV